MKRFNLIPHPAVLLGLAAAGLLAGCATQPSLSSTANTAAALQIDGLTINQLLPASERDRINRQIPALYRGIVISSEALGQLVYAHERLAVAASNLVAPAGHSTLGFPLAGWLTQRRPSGLRVLFIVKLAGGLAVAAEVDQPATGKPQLRRLSPPRALSPGEQALWNARQLAFQARFKPCAKQYNPVVIPLSAQDNDFYYVYLLPVGRDADLLYLGGYYRVTVSADGSHILNTHAFTHACLTLQRNRKATGAGVTELISPTPTPPQVYASLHYGFPLYVATATNSIVWDVKDGKIYYVRTMPPKK